MTKNLDDEGLRSVFYNYELFFIDLWGVVHNGIELHKNAINTLSKITEAKKNYILLTNAPRPNKIVKIFLENLGLDKSMSENVFTSGEAALSYLKKNNFNVTVYNRTQSKAEQWSKEYGDEYAITPAKAVINSEAVFICVGRDEDLMEVMEGKEGILTNTKEGVIIVDHTTASADIAREYSRKCQDLNKFFLDNFFIFPSFVDIFSDVSLCLFPKFNNFIFLFFHILFVVSNKA